jgi:hypothetical protein
MPPKLPPPTVQIREAGAIVHACAHLALGDQKAKRYFGNRNFSTTLLQGVVRSSNDGRKKTGDRANWELNVDFTLPETDGTTHEVVNVTVLARNCTLGEVPAGSNKKNGVILTGVITAAAAAAATPTAAATTTTTSAATTTAAASNTTAATANTTAATAIAAAASSADKAAEMSSSKRSSSSKRGSKKSSDATVADSSSIKPPSSPPKKKKKKNKKEIIDLNETPMYVETNDGKKHRVVTLANGVPWCEGNKETVTGSVADGVDASDYPWSQKSFTGDKVSPRNTDYQDMTCLQAFEMMMPPKQIKLILELTNKNLKEKDKSELTHGELFRFFGVCMLMALSRFRGNRRFLWGEGEGRASISKYLPEIDLKPTSMSRNRWEDIWYAFQTSRQPPDCPLDMSPEEFRWTLVNDFIDNFNDYRNETFIAGFHIEVDESMICWYGIGGEWRNDGSPHY